MDELAGYRVLRTAAIGTRSRVLLGFRDGETVVLKASATDDPRTAAEVTALDRGAGEHVVALLDVAADETETVLVLERLGAGTLADLLDRRASLDAGEAVTILAPLATTLERLHAAGVAHGALSLATVGFGDDGAPALLGFGAAVAFPPGAPEVVRETVPAVLEDRAALRGLAALVLGRVAGPGADAARRLAAGLGDAAPAAIAERLFGLAPPVAVRFAPDEDDSGMPRVAWAATLEVPVGDPPALPSWLVALVPDDIRGRVGEALARARGLWDAASPRRRRLVLGIAAGTLAALVLGAVLPASPGPVPGASEPAATAEAPGAAEPVADPLPEDPVAAARLLIARRSDCLRELSVLCLADVVQAGSSAQDDDVALVRAVLAGAELPGDGIRPGSPVLVERLGDSALLDLPAGSDPGSILLLRTPEGWRIRDYLPPPVSGTPARETPEARAERHGLPG